MEFRSLHTVDTAENIRLRIELAGLANRVFAYLIDALIMLTLMGVVTLLFGLPSIIGAGTEIGRTATPLAMFVIIFGYHMLQEWLWNGKTIGKTIFNIRVVRGNGQPIGFWEAFGRNLLRVLDVYVSGIGLLVMMFNQDEKRLGDFIAGTVVINDQAVLKPAKPSVSAATPAEPAAVSGEPRILSPEEIELLKVWRQRRRTVFAGARQQLSRGLCDYFSERLQYLLESDADLDALLDGSERGTD